MDKSSLAGIIIAFTAIIGGQILEGGNLHSLVQTTAFLIVIGGTLGAIMLQTSPTHFMRGVRMARWVIKPPKFDYEDLITRIFMWANVGRKTGLLSLESMIDQQENAFHRKALQLLVDGVEPEMMRETLMIEITAYEEQAKRAAKIWDAAGGYAPTIGILGAVMGLIHVMENLSDPARLGSGIAVAFVATIYGVGTANLIFLPIGHKLKSVIHDEVRYRELLVEGILGVANGENPRIIQARLEGMIG